MHYTLQMLFLELLSSEMPAANAMWHAAGSDGSKRNLLKALLENTTPKSPAASAGALWLLETIGILTPYRNDATHVPTGPDSTKNLNIRPLVQVKPAKRLTARPDAYRFHRLLRDDLYVLNYFAMAILAEMKAPGHFVFPEPPILQSVLQKARFGQSRPGPDVKAPGRKTKPRT